MPKISEAAIEMMATTEIKNLAGVISTVQEWSPKCKLGVVSLKKNGDGIQIKSI